MSEIKWLPAALEDVERLYLFLFEKNPQAAESAAKTILEGAKLLETSLYIGQPMNDETKRRELILSFGSGAYIIRYMVQEKSDTAVILCVWHSRERRD